MLYKQLCMCIWWHEDNQVPGTPIRHKTTQTYPSQQQSAQAHCQSPYNQKSQLQPGWGNQPYHSSGLGYGSPEASIPSIFDTIGNMSKTYTIKTNPSITPVQHIQRKVPIEYWDQIEKTLDDMVVLRVIAPVIQPTQWVSSLTYPHKPDGSLHICLNPKDLNKATVWEHYKAPTLDDIGHWLSGATCSVSLIPRMASEASTTMKSSHTYLHSTPTMVGTGYCTCHSVLRCPKMFSRCA